MRILDERAAFFCGKNNYFVMVFAYIAITNYLSNVKTGTAILYSAPGEPA